jgi:rhomboid family GlyGly-CTERM serine protease
VPCVSLLLAACAVAVHLIPGAPERLELNRAAIISRELWRILTGHFVHFGGDHLLWDVLVFVVLGSICERLDRRRFLWTIVGSTLLISTIVAMCLPSIEAYRGLSGVDSALFGLLTGMLFTRCTHACNRIGAIAVLGMVIAFSLKIAIEVRLGVTVFADSHGGGYAPVPLAHLVGLITGLVCSGVASISPFADKMQGLCPRP